MSSFYVILPTNNKNKQTNADEIIARLAPVITATTATFGFYLTSLYFEIPIQVSPEEDLPRKRLWV